MNKFGVVIVGIFTLLLSEISGESCSTAKRWGFICMDERTTAICASFDGTNFMEIDPAPCPPVTPFCNEEYRNCSLTASLNSNYAESFVCPDNDLYPDLGNCKRYLVCQRTGATAIPIECPAGLMFNIKGKCCSKELTDSECAKRKVKCENLGEVAPLTEDNQYFYYCRTVTGTSLWYPQLMKCSDGQVFNGFQCAEKSAVTTKSVTIPAPAPTIPLPPCIQGTIDEHPTECRSYRYCHSGGNWKTYSCGPANRFDSTIKKCIIGNC